MKKTLLLFAAMLFSLVASAGDGLVAVGANVILLPSSYWDGDIEWKAWTWVYNTGVDYGAPYGVENGSYNIICGFPSDDANDREWFEPDYNMADIEDFNEDLDQTIVWEERTAPYSSDETFHNRTSYRWTTNNIMADIYVRRTFTIPAGQLLAGPVYLACGHDDAPAQYFLNGELVYERTGFETNDNGNILNGWNNAEYILLTDEQKALIKLNGEENIIAFSVHQNWGGAFADCGLYTKAEGGLDMGYTTPWEGKVLFNNYGGYGGHIINNQPDLSTTHPWSKLYEAQAGDEYTFLLEGASKDDYNYEEWREQLDFKTPIKIEDGHTYSFKARIEADKPFAALIVKLGDNDNDDIELAYEEMTVEAPEEGYEEDYEGTLIDIEFYGEEVNNFRVAFDFGGGQDSTNVAIKEMSLRDITDGDSEEAPELWVGTHYFNFFDMYKTVVKYLIFDEELGDYREATEEEREWAEEVVDYEPVDAPEINGRVETLAWTQADFDDSMWDDQMMPVGSADYTYRESEWPGGDNTNYWIRRNFELDKVNDRLSYELNVCHDDTYETYVNGHLLQKNTGWTDGKNPVQVHIPAKYLNVGKNVIATYIQQNWGGKFYDCGINVTEVNYEECVQLFNDAIAFAEESTDALLTNKMKANIKAIIAEAKQYFKENQNDPAELRNYAREMKTRINAILAYSPAVKTLKDTYDICCRMEDKGYWGTALEDAIAALDTCATSSELNKYLTPLREARKATAMERRTEKFVGSAPQAVPMDLIGYTDYLDYEDQIVPRYYIYNLGAKLFLGAGEDWGTHLALEYASNPMMLIQAERDAVDEDGEPTGEIEVIEGAYYVETFRPNGEIGTGDFLGWNGYIDVGLGSTWEFIPVEGKPNVYNIAQYGQTFTAEGKTYAGTAYEPGGKKYLGLRSGDNAYAPSYYIVDTDLHSPELETNQWMLITREEMLGFLKTATEENPADLTFLIENPGYDQRWTIDNWMFTNGSVLGRGGNNAQFVFEAYNADDFWMGQDIFPEEAQDALPAGTYVLEVQGYYRDGIEGAHVDKVLADQPIVQRALIFASINDDEGATVWEETMPLMPIHIEANKVPGIGYGADKGLQMPGTYSGQPMNAVNQAGLEYFPCGLYWNKFAFTLEEATDRLSIGIDKQYDEDRPNGDWCVMDNWRLKYYGTNVEDPDAIQGVVSDEINKTNTASKGIYNMLGQRLSKVQKGVNIINGKKVVKK